jgi:acetylornithine deacetylase/succinyl-diaminopimelate desuccinylase-like protein
MDDLYAYIDEHADEYLDLLIRLGRQPSISAQNVGIDEMRALVIETLQEAGLQARPLEGEGGPPAVFGELRGASDRTILFYDHYDVQPPEPLELWETEPFVPTVRDGKLYGRGIADNKGPFASRVAAIKAWQAVRGPLPVSVKFFVEGEEEIGSPHIVPMLERNRETLRADGCIWEHGGVNWAGTPYIKLGLKGMLYLQLDVKGAARDIHSSEAVRVPNPVWELVWALNTLRDRDENILIEGFYDDVAPPSEADLAAARAVPSDEADLKKAWGFERFVKHLTGPDLRIHTYFQPTCNIAGIVAGYTGEGAKTVLPSRAHAKIDFRLVPNQSPADIAEKVRRHLDRHGFGHVMIRPDWHGVNPTRTPADHPWVKVVAEAGRKVYRRETVIEPTSLGSGPMWNFRHMLELPIASSGSSYPNSGAHAPNEHIRIADFVSAVKHAATIMDELARAERVR